MQKLRQDVNIGKNIKNIRKLNNLTQEQVVTKLQLQGIQISRSIYSQIELGTYNIKISELIALKNLFNVDFNDFFKNL